MEKTQEKIESVPEDIKMATGEEAKAVKRAEREEQASAVPSTKGTGAGTGKKIKVSLGKGKKGKTGITELIPEEPTIQKYLQKIPEDDQRKFFLRKKRALLRDAKKKTGIELDKDKKMKKDWRELDKAISKREDLKDDIRRFRRLKEYPAEQTEIMAKWGVDRKKEFLSMVQAKEKQSIKMMKAPTTEIVKTTLPLKLESSPEDDTLGENKECVWISQSYLANKAMFLISAAPSSSFITVNDVVYADLTQYTFIDDVNFKRYFSQVVVPVGTKMHGMLEYLHVFADPYTYVTPGVGVSPTFISWVEDERRLFAAVCGNGYVLVSPDATAIHYEKEGRLVYPALKPDGSLVSESFRAITLEKKNKYSYTVEDKPGLWGYDTDDQTFYNEFSGPLTQVASTICCFQKVKKATHTIFSDVRVRPVLHDNGAVGGLNLGYDFGIQINSYELLRDLPFLSHMKYVASLDQDTIDMLLIYGNIFTMSFNVHRRVKGFLMKFVTSMPTKRIGLALLKLLVKTLHKLREASWISNSIGLEFPDVAKFLEKLPISLPNLISFFNKFNIREFIDAIDGLLDVYLFEGDETKLYSHFKTIFDVCVEFYPYIPAFDGVGMMRSIDATTAAVNEMAEVSERAVRLSSASALADQKEVATAHVNKIIAQLKASRATLNALLLKPTIDTSTMAGQILSATQSASLIKEIAVLDKKIKIFNSLLNRIKDSESSEELVAYLERRLDVEMSKSAERVSAGLKRTSKERPKQKKGASTAEKKMTAFEELVQKSISASSALSPEEDEGEDEE